ncbi:hypothetical protein DERF_014774 [Dermatophagoides farinae]|uniref:Uncharacterized protein n=1 Tax=Dermatophagoides farinae TaxID=6954 RepID=A0A922HMW5_DERFA|nr:hypothetical protein DERF_014774 [Dermatophagoides farinae]
MNHPLLARLLDNIQRTDIDVGVNGDTVTDSGTVSGGAGNVRVMGDSEDQPESPISLVAFKRN